MSKLNFDYINDKKTRTRVKDLYYEVGIYEKSNRPYISNFLNPAVQNHIIKLLYAKDIPYRLEGGSAEAERKVLILGEIYEDPFAVLYGETNNESISHRDVLGAIMALGLDREDIGDIVINSPRIELAVVPHRVQDITSGLTQIGKFPMIFNVKDKPILQEDPRQITRHKASVASLRLDNLIAEMAKTSRSKAQGLIKLGKIKLNHEEEKNQGAEVNFGDTISIRGLGRFKLKENLGRSKKDRILIEYLKRE